MKTLQLKERVNWHPVWRIDRFRDPNNHIGYLIRSQGLHISGMAPIGIDLRILRRRYAGYSLHPGNLLLNVGINSIWGLITALNSQTAYSNAAAYIGVGDSNTAATASQTGLQGSNKTFKAMNTSYPTAGTSQQAVWQSTFASGDANYAWNEILVASGNNPPTTGIAMNRLVSAMGTKASGATWVATLTISLS